RYMHGGPPIGQTPNPPPRALDGAEMADQSLRLPASQAPAESHLGGEPCPVSGAVHELRRAILEFDQAIVDAAESSGVGQVVQFQSDLQRADPQCVVP